MLKNFDRMSSELDLHATALLFLLSLRLRRAALPVPFPAAPSHTTGTAAVPDAS